MNFEEVKDLIRLIDQSSLTEFEFEQADFSVWMSKNESTSVGAALPLHPEKEEREERNIKENKTVSNEVRTPAPEPVPPVAEDKTKGTFICSPIVGVVYLQADPESDPYVAQGEQVSKGQVVCLVEAMKIMNEIKSDFSGEIAEILIENEQVVEYNQPLFRIV